MLLKMDIVKKTHLTLVNLEILTVSLFKRYIILIMKLLPWKWLKRRISAKIKRCGFFLHPLDDRHRMNSEAFGRTNRHCCRNSSEKLQEGFVIIKGKRMGSYHLKAQLQMQSTGASFCIFLYLYIFMFAFFYPNFITCLYFPLALIN